MGFGEEPMRVLAPAAVATAALILAGCQQSTSQASETAPPPRKDLGRSQVFYQGQGPIVKLDSATVEPGKAPDTLVLKAKGEAAGPGYTDIRFLRRIYPAPPPDGIYEVDVVATRPKTAGGAAAATPIEIKGDWTAYPKSRLKAVRFMAQTNSVTAPVPAAPAG
jgi:hypothetical protein